MFEGLVTVIGGSGFIGRYVVQALARKRYRVRVAVRRPDLAGHLQPLGGLGQIHAVQANIRYPASVQAACEGADAVVNLVGVLSQQGKQTFSRVHGFGARVAARAAVDAGARSLVHVSAIGADPQSPAEYGRSKAQGEAEIREGFPDASILRPSIVFGPEDEFFNRFAGLARYSPVMPLIGGGQTRFQPVFAGDVADAVCVALERPAARAGTYELGGPRIMTFERVLRYILDTVERKRLLVPVPFAAAKLMGAVLGVLPEPLLTLDQVRMLEIDNVVSSDAERAGMTLPGLGLSPQAIEGVVPEYLERFRRSGQFQRSRPEH